MKMRFFFTLSIVDRVAVMVHRHKFKLCCFFLLSITLLITRHPGLLSSYQKSTLKLIDTKSIVYDEAEDPIDRRQTIDYLKNASRYFSHYKPSSSPKTHFSGTNTTVCMIPKNGHAVIQYVSCLLTFKETGDNMNYKRFAPLMTYNGAFDDHCPNTVHRLKPGSEGFKHIVFIRDPLERFISGWLFLCKRNGICYHCGLDFDCFFKTLYMCWKTEYKYAEICTYNTPSPDSPDNRSSHIYIHMFPQVSHCNLLWNREGYEVIDYSIENINNFLLSSARPILNRVPYENLKGRLQQQTVHASSKKDAEELKSQIKSNREFTSMFALLYYMDYQKFDIKLPSFIVNHKLFEKEN